MKLRRFSRKMTPTRGAAVASGVLSLALVAGGWNWRTAPAAPDDTSVAKLYTIFPESAPDIRLCQACNTGNCLEAEASGCSVCNTCNACNPAICGVDCLQGDGCREPTWCERGPIPWQVFAQGEYLGPHRTAHTPEYRLRVDDQLDFIYRLTREQIPNAYELNVGDSVRVESLTDQNIDRQELVIQPDGSITLRLLGQVHAARRTVAELTKELEEKYTKYYRMPSITVTPLRVNTKLEDLRATVDRRAGVGGQSVGGRVIPDGTVQLVAIGAVPAVGLTLAELKAEIDCRYSAIVQGIEVTPVLVQRAPRQVFVIGEVRSPGRFTMDGPTTLMQSLAMAGGWNVGANLREVVVFRRAEDWRLIATKLDIRGALYGTRPIPADEIWIRDADVVVVPKHPILQADNFVELVFTKGIYGLLPFSTTYSLGGATIQ